MNHLLHLINPEILVVSEHGQNKSKIVNTRLINYSLVSAFSRDNVIKGGVAIYKQEGLNTEIASLDVEHLSTPLVCEVTAISVVVDRRSNLYILGVYRPPRKDKDSFAVALETISAVLDEWVSSKNTIVIVGDFNVDSLEPSTERTQLEELLMSYNISRLNLPPTRVTKETVSSIDIFCISSESLNEVDFQVACTGISDHTGQFFRVSTKTKINSTITSTRRQINNNSVRNLKDQLSEQGWGSVFESDNTEEAYNNFLTTLTLSLNSACPLVKARVKPPKSIKQAFDAEAGQLKAQFLDALDTFTLTGRREDKELANELKKSYDMKLRLLRKEVSATYITESSNKSRAVWNVINSERQQKREPSNSVKLNIDGLEASDPVVISNKFNDYFASIAEVTLENIKDQKTKRLQSCDWRINHPLAEFAPWCHTWNEQLNIIRL